MGKPFIIGLTGGIGAGKSTVGSMFIGLGAGYYNSDEHAKLSYYNQDVYNKITLLLGNEAYISENQINNKYIANLVFSNKELLKKVENILHPYITKMFENYVAICGKNYIVKESAVLFESGEYKNTDVNILVTAPLEVRIDRVIKRDNCSAEDVLKRINNQWNELQTIPLADYIIYNDGQKELQDQVEDTFLKILKK